MSEKKATLDVKSATDKSPTPSPTEATGKRKTSFGGISSSDAGAITVMKCYEHNRYYPVVGWSKNLLPTDPPRWAAEDGKTPRRRHEFELPAGMKWTGEWEIEVKEGETDVEGWQYAVDFGSHVTWYPTGTARASRRRCWLRFYGAIKTEDHKKTSGGSRGESKDGETKQRKKPAREAEVVTVSCFENQRYYPVIGWSSKLLPTDRPAWSDDEGKAITKDKLDTQLPAGWRWLGDWSVSVHDRDDKSACDIDGWSYGVDFPQAEFHDSKHLNDFVRKRKWARKRANVPDSKQFGVPYENCETEEVSGYASPIPTVLVRMKKYLTNNAGLDVPGIFRLGSDPDETNKVKDELNHDNFVHCNDVNCVANLIKQWFREMPTPLLAALEKDAEPTAAPSALSALSASSGSINPSSMASMSQVGDIISGLSEPNKSLMEWLLDLCVKVVQNASANRMTAEALANVFAPLLVRPGKDAATVAMTKMVAKFFAGAVEYRKKKTSSYLFFSKTFGEDGKKRGTGTSSSKGAGSD